MPTVRGGPADRGKLRELLNASRVLATVNRLKDELRQRWDCAY